MYNQQPMAAQQPTQPTQPTQSKKISIVLDDEAYEILANAYPEIVQHLINIAIKRFSETLDYEKYYLRKEFRDQSKITELINHEENIPDVSQAFQRNQAAQSEAQLVQSESQSSKLAFDAW